ncbi:CRP/FNR family transcription regulator, partial [Listeria ivanovii FSL F6-596]
PNLRKLEEEGILTLSPKPWRINDFETHKQNLTNTYKSYL